MLSQLSPEVQDKFNEQHSSLRVSAAAIGEELPAISSVGVLEEAPLATEAQEGVAGPASENIGEVLISNPPGVIWCRKW